MGKEQKTIQKFVNIDLVRFILALFVVAIHISPLKQINGEADFFFTRILGRLAVPIFLTITGFFVMPKSVEDVKYLKTYTLKILKLYAVCILVYIPVNIYMGYFKELTIVQFVKDILINGTLYHLWYFPALILGMWIVYLLLKKTNVKTTFWLCILLYVIGLLGDSYYGLVLKSPVLTSVYENIFKVFEKTRCGLFLVPIFVYLGYVVNLRLKGKEIQKEGKEKIKEVIENKSNIKYLILSIGLFVCMSIEGFVLHKLNYQRHDSMYVFLIPVVYYFFIYIMSISKSSNTKLRDIATLIYILHPLVIVGARFASKVLNIESILSDNNFVLYVFVCVFTTLFSVAYLKLKNVILKKK